MRQQWFAIPALWAVASIAIAQSTIAEAVVAQTPVVHFEIDAARDVKPISRYIYGVNQFHLFFDGLDGPWSHAAFIRLGGNRFTAYNWTSNASQAGSDYQFHNDDYLVSGDAYKGITDAPGGALIPVIELARAHDAACLLTVPINGYVAADKNPDGDVRKTPDFLHVRFKQEQPRKGSPFTLTPDPKNPRIFQDEFINWVKTKYPYGQTDPKHPIWFSLDNEPDYWNVTHPEIHPAPTTYAELIDKSIEYAEAIKSVEPNTLIFGPANYGWLGYLSLQMAPDAKDRDFQEYYLQTLRAAEITHHRRLLDVLDVHWYPEATGASLRIDQDKLIPQLLAARVQAPRSLWDPNYVETSWITKDSLKGESIRLIPRLMGKIARNYPGTKLSISEYDYGGGTNISGGIAEADALGIFGSQGVFAAALWVINNVPFTGGGFEMFRNFDGRNGSFGNISVHAQTDDIAESSVYASMDSTDPNRLVVVAINKTNHAIDSDFHFAHANWSSAITYQLTGVSPTPKPGGQISATNVNEANYLMPANSVNTLVFILRS